MAVYYRVEVEKTAGVDLLRINFAEPAQNDQIVTAAYWRLAELIEAGEIAGGKMVKLNGPASLPVAVTIAHAVAHLYEVVAVFDPKLGKYVVSVSHTADYRPGDLID